MGMTRSATHEAVRFLLGRRRPRWKERPAISLRSLNRERITPINLPAAQGRAKELLDAVKAKLGLVPNMTRSMAVAPPVLDFPKAPALAA